jgi:hypothetical protein
MAWNSCHHLTDTLRTKLVHGVEEGQENDTKWCGVTRFSQCGSHPILGHQQYEPLQLPMAKAIWVRFSITCTPKLTNWRRFHVCPPISRTLNIPQPTAGARSFHPYLCISWLISIHKHQDFAPAWYSHV